MGKIAKIHNEKLQKINMSPSYGATVVLVTDQFRCERLIRCGKLIADITGSELCVLNLQNGSLPSNPEAMQHLFNVSSQHGAVMQILYSDNALRAISDYIKENKIGCVISGMPGTADSLLHQIWAKFTRVHFFTVNENGKMEEVIYRKTHGIPQEKMVQEIQM